MPSKILFLDDRWAEEKWREQLTEWLPDSVETVYESEGHRALRRLGENPDVKLVFLDLHFEGQPEQGEQILNGIKEQYPDLKVIILTSVNDAQLALRLVHDEGKAYYYFFKDSIDPNQLVKLVENAIEAYDLEAVAVRKTDAGVIVGESRALREALRLVERAGRIDEPVLVTGETGTGKELFARAVHAAGRRRGGPFVVVNCPALSDELAESELFGHVRGSFTGAVRDKQGFFQRAHRGTIFLDEIGDLKLHHQAKLLRVLQFGEFNPVGDDRPSRADVRVIAATNRNLEQEVRRGNFREDLLYRLNVFRIRTPSLRDIPEDIPLLVRHHLQRLGNEYGQWKDISPEATESLSAYGWPGNVRQLENLLKRAYFTSLNETLEKEDFADELSSATAEPASGAAAGVWAARVVGGEAKWDDIANEFAASGGMRRQIVEGVIELLTRDHGRRPTGEELAALLGITRNYMNVTLSKLGIRLRTPT